jgi:hypothetical protein
MSLRILVDMNLSPDWVEWFKRQDCQAVHWSTVGDPKATDSVIMSWARERQHVVFTHDLDFGTFVGLDERKRAKRDSGSGPGCLPGSSGTICVGGAAPT